jgi:hypothetical protein
MLHDGWAKLVNDELGPISNPFLVLQFTTVAIEALGRGYC